MNSRHSSLLQPGTYACFGQPADTVRPFMLTSQLQVVDDGEYGVLVRRGSIEHMGSRKRVRFEDLGKVLGFHGVSRVSVFSLQLKWVRDGTG